MGGNTEGFTVSSTYTISECESCGSGQTLPEGATFMKIPGYKLGTDSHTEAHLSALVNWKCGKVANPGKVCILFHS
jgi:hypothetical protein